MTATIVLHPRLRPDAATRRRLTDLLADLLVREAQLRAHVIPEARARQVLDGSAHVGWRLRQQARARLAGEPLTGIGRADFLATYRWLVRRLHPAVDIDRAAPCYLWAMANRAFRAGDMPQLAECVGACPEAAPLPDEARLRAALAGVQLRVRRLEARLWPVRSAGEPVPEYA